MFFEIARIVHDRKPAYLLLENVKGLLSHDSGNTFATIISALDELGYDCQWQVCNSKYFGVPQNRERVYIIGHLRGKSRPEVFPINTETETNLEGDEKFIDLQFEGAKVTRQTRTIQARYYKGYSTRNGENSGVLVGTLRTFTDGKGFREIKSGLSPTINARGREDGNGQPVIAVPLKFLERNQKNFQGDYSFTIDTANTGGIMQNKKIRRLTPIECERLQGFPDNWTQGVSDTQRYKQLGNAVTVNVVYEIAKRL